MARRNDGEHYRCALHNASGCPECSMDGPAPPEPTAATPELPEETEWPVDPPQGCEVFGGKRVWYTRVHGFLLADKSESQRDAVVSAWNCVTDFGESGETARLRERVAELERERDGWAMALAVDRPARLQAEATVTQLRSALEAALVAYDAWEEPHTWGEDEARLQTFQCAIEALRGTLTPKERT